LLVRSVADVPGVAANLSADPLVYHAGDFDGVLSIDGTEQLAAQQPPIAPSWGALTKMRYKAQGFAIRLPSAWSTYAGKLGSHWELGSTPDTGSAEGPRLAIDVYHEPGGFGALQRRAAAHPIALLRPIGQARLPIVPGSFEPPRP
jgi:hypothetical protein